jgi:FSR family fosmidomycin resistance protein-like MFS transporter
MEFAVTPPRSLYILPPIAKGFTTFYFVLLPIFYVGHIITTKQIGYIGALYITFLILGAIAIVRWLHALETRKMLVGAALVSILATILLLIGSIRNSLALIIISYCLMGAVSGTTVSGFAVLAANYTKRGDRFIMLAKLGTLGDVLRIAFPLLATVAVAIGDRTGAVVLVLAVSVLFFVLCLGLPKRQGTTHLPGILPPGKLRHNKAFRFVMGVEFADSFSSSQLYVFLPLLFLAKGYSLSNGLVLQSFVFLGYLGGRWLVSYLAHRYSGIRSIGYAELGMVASIVLLLTIEQLWLLYVVSFTLGVFVRGTAPTIKGIVLDTLEEDQMKRGSAVYTIVGDGGSALGQLIFGFLAAWYGAKSPFIVAAIIVALTGVACLAWPKNRPYSEQ